LRVYLIRHGETEYNRTMKVQGHAEIPLNDLGIRQAAQLARRFTGVRLDRIYASDLRRATMTATILAAHTGAPLLYDPGLRERDPGDLTHKDYQESIRFFTDPAYEPPGGETHRDFLVRVRRTFEALIEREVARELWEQGSSGVDLSAGQKKASTDFTDDTDSMKKDTRPMRRLDPGLQDLGPKRNPDEEFPAAGAGAGMSSSDSSDKSAPSEDLSSNGNILSPIAVPAAPGIDLDAVPHLALVTHGMVCRAFVDLFAPTAPPPGLRWLNTSLSILDYHPAERRWHVHVLADAAHLDAPQPAPDSAGASTGG
jgi:2,3-bisphosphoglycerate-dependent phosphoglycerate mutase